MTVAKLKAAQADAPDGVGQVPHGVPRDYNFAADVLRKISPPTVPTSAAAMLSGMALAVLWATGAFSQSPSAEGSNPMPVTAGYIETVTFPDYGITLDAKLDTGADSSSIGVTGLDRFKRNGKIWYRFTLTGADGKTATIEQQSDRVARVMRAEVKDTRRPIVRLKVCVAGQTAVTDFTLTDRSEQRTSLLIGRRFLASRILVDSSRKHVFPKPCEGRK